MTSINYKELSFKKYMPIKIDQLLVGDILPFDLYVKDINIFKYLFNKGTMFTETTKEFLKQNGISEVYLLDIDMNIMEDYLSKHKSQRSPLNSLAMFKDSLVYKERYHQIDRNLLIPHAEINFSLFGIDRSNITVLIEASETSPAKINENITAITGDIFIKKTDIPFYHAYFDLLLASKRFPFLQETRLKAFIIKENSKIVVRDLLGNPRSGEKIKESIILVNNALDCIFENRHTIYDLLSIRNYDYYTYTHSVNVAVLAIGLGIAVNLKRYEIEKLGIGALLHDIGKSIIPPELLNKNGKLNDDEFEIMKTHVLEGQKILKAHKEISEESLVPALQHHEKLTGKGYPQNLSGNDIKLFGRITAIADCYDALTTRRSYKPALTPFDALNLIKNETGNYDTDLLAAFIKMLGGITHSYIRTIC